MITRLLKSGSEPLTELVVAGRAVPVRLVENKRAKRVILRVEARTGGIRVTVPPRCSTSRVRSFLEANRSWIAARLDGLEAAGALASGGVIDIYGCEHRIEFSEAKRGSVDVVVGDEGALLLVRGQEEQIGQRIGGYLKFLAQGEITPMAHELAGQIGERVQSVRYRDTKSRWGSCSTAGNLSFNWRIMMAPRQVIEYLVAHEVAHLREMNHGPKFWALCRDLCAETEECRAWLKNNGARLQAVAFS